MTRSELMKGFLTSLTKQTLIGIHNDFKLKTVVDMVTSWKGVWLINACLCPLYLTTV